MTERYCSLRLETWDIPGDDIEDLYVLQADDGMAYLMLVLRGRPELAIFSDPDFDLVVFLQANLAHALEYWYGPMDLPDFVAAAREGTGLYQAVPE